jgi:hypothetical protein
MNNLDKATIVFAVIFFVLTGVIYKMPNLRNEAAATSADFFAPVPIVKNEMIPRFSAQKKTFIFIAYIILIILTALMAASKKKALKVIGAIALVVTILIPIVLVIGDQYVPFIRNWIAGHPLIKTIIDKIMDVIRRTQGRINIIMHGMPKAPYA